MRMRAGRGREQGRLGAGLLSAGLMDCAGGLAWFAVSRAGADRGVTDLPLGMLGGAFFLTYCLCCPLMGRLSDRVGRRRVMLCGMALAWGALRWARAWEALWVGWAAMALFGVGMSAFWPPLIAWLGAGITGPRLLDRLVIFSLAWNVGIMVGSGMGGWLYERGPALPLDVASGLVPFAALVLLWPARAQECPTAGEVNPGMQGLVAPGIAGGRRRLVWMAWLGEFASGAGMGTLGALFPQLAVSRELSPGVHGSLLGWARVTSLLTYAWLMRARFWRLRARVLIGAGVLTAAGYLLIPLGPGWGLWWIAFAVAGVASAFFYLSSLYYSLLAAEAGREGVGSSAHEAVVGAGLLAGPLLGGLVGHCCGEEAPYILSAAVFLLVVAVQMGLALGRAEAGAVSPAGWRPARGDDAGA